MSTDTPPRPTLKQNVLAFADVYLKWKTRPRPTVALPPNPADYDLTPEQGQDVIDTCHSALEQVAVERAMKPHRPAGT